MCAIALCRVSTLDPPAAWSSVDILINNAGLSRGLDKLHEASFQDWEEMIDTNIKGLLYLTRFVVPGMVSRGRGHGKSWFDCGHQTYPGGNVTVQPKPSELFRRVETRSLGNTGALVCRPWFGGNRI